MIGVFVTFHYEAGFEAERLVAIAEKARLKFEGMTGLRSKAFTINTERQEAINFYIWESESAARAFFTPALVTDVGSLYGTQPTISFVQIAALVDNGRS